jgi:hypothetical protein
MSPQAKLAQSRARLRRVRNIWLTISLVLLACGIGVALSRVQPTIHSCDAYVPSRLDAVVDTGAAVWNFIREEGFMSLLRILKQVVQVQLRGFSDPDFFGVESIRGKTLLMVGGGYIREFLKRSQYAGVNIVLVDDVKLQNKTVSLVHRFLGISEFGRKSVQDPERFVVFLFS